MFSRSKILGILLAIAITFVVLPLNADARNGSIKNIESGDHIFVYETGLNLSGLDADPGAGTTSPTSLRKFVDDDVTKAIIKEISIGNVNSFDLPSSIVGSNYGIYYPFSSGVTYSGGEKANSMQSVTVDQTDLQLGVYLASSRIDSIDGKTITRDNDIVFKLVASNMGTYYRYNENGTYRYPGMVDIEVSTPDGGSLTTFGGVYLSGLRIIGYENWTPSIDLEGVTAGRYTAVMSFSSGQDFYRQSPDSNTVSFTVSSKPLTIMTNKETVVRGSSFLITITGEANNDYYVFVKGDVSNCPVVADSQVNVAKANATYAIISLDSSGTGKVMFNTNSSTEDKTYTINVEDMTDKSRYDSVDIQVTKGAITMSATGSGTYYFGETVELSGSNSETEMVYLYLTGPNLNTNGVRLDDIDMPVVDGNSSTFKAISVDADNNWKYKWDTGDLGGTVLDAGSYTLYAASEPYGARSLSDTSYTTMSVQFNKGYISIKLSSNSVASGDKFKITGTASGHPDNVYIWIFGKNYRSMFNAESVESDGTYEYLLDSGETDDMYYGQYFVVVQHPMANGPGVCAVSSSSGDCNSGPVCSNGDSGCNYIAGDPDYYTFGTVSVSGLQSSDAATALTNALASPNIDDTYSKASFNIEAPFIRLASISDRMIGDNLTVSGTTNLAEGDRIQIDITSASFQPTQKTQTGEFSGASGVVYVERGSTYNTFKFQIDTNTFREDEYIVTANAMETGTSATTSFNLFVTPPSPVPTPTTPTVITTIPTPPVITTLPPTPVPTTTKKGAPGFEAISAIVALAIAIMAILLIVKGREKRTQRWDEN